jgi:hypothetical protein
MTTTITQEQGYTGLSLKIPRIVTTSTLSQVTTAGWYNNNPISGETSLNPQDLVAICYSYGASAQASGIFSVSITNGVVTLSLADSTVVLPTIANHIATYTNTSGGLSEDPATAISGGNIQAGLSGTAGTLASFPATAAKGSFVFKAVANTGNTNTTLSNDAMGQASVINIPDPGNAVGQLLIGATATPLVNGNFPQNSGTAGLVVDSGVSVASISSAITQLGVLYQVSVTLNTATMTTAYATPAQLIAAVAGKVIQIISASVYTASTGNTAYATGTAPIIQYGSTVHGGGTLATGAGLVAGDITASTSQVRTLPGIASSALTGVTNTGIYFSNATNNYTGGTGTNVTFNIVYMLITATV